MKQLSLALSVSALVAVACGPLQTPEPTPDMMPSAGPTSQPVTPTAEPAPTTVPGNDWDTVLAEARAWETALPPDEPREMWILVRQDSTSPSLGPYSEPATGDVMDVHAWEYWSYVDAEGLVVLHLSAQYNAAGQIVQLASTNQQRWANWSFGSLQATTGVEVPYLPNRGVLEVLESLRTAQTTLQVDVLTHNDTPVRRYTLRQYYSEPLRGPDGELLAPDIGAIQIIEVNATTGEWLRDERQRILPGDEVVPAGSIEYRFTRGATPSPALLATFEWLAPEANPQQRLATRALAVDPQGRWVAIGYVGGVRVHDLTNFEDVGGVQLAPDEWAAGLAFSPDSTQLAVNVQSYQTEGMGAGMPLGGLRLEVRSTANWASVYSAPLEPYINEEVTWAADGRLSTLNGFQFRTWVGEDFSQTQITVSQQSGTDSISAFDFAQLSPDGTLFAASTSPAPSIRVADNQGDWQRLAAGDLDGLVQSLAFSDDSRQLFAATNDGHVTAWNLDTREVAWRLSTGPGTSVFAWSPDRVYLATDGDALRVWPAGSNTPLWESGPLFADITALAWTPDGRAVISLDALGTATVWDAATGTMLGELSPAD